MGLITGLISFLYGEKHDRPPEAGGIWFRNTLTGKKESFAALKNRTVSMYNCGPTVYDFAHIGNLRSYVFADLLRRLFEWNGYKVNQVINITDVGHLVGDGDVGADKVEEGAKREGKSAKEITDYFLSAFLVDLKALNISTSKIKFPRATEHLNEQIAMIKTLEEKGYTYKTGDGIYFDTSLFQSYGALGKIDLKNLKAGARVELNKDKKNPADFALWKFSKPEEHRQQEWKSPWGVGFPGWHIECSAMSMKYLGKTFDIHTGGVDHISVHHNNEIAQSEAVTGRPFVRYWLHNEFLSIEGRKISKSLGNTVYLKNIADRGIPPLVFRYWLLTSHYRTPTNFTWESLEAAKTALWKAHKYFVEELPGKSKTEPSAEYLRRFTAAINDDLDTPRAVALLWELIKDPKLPKDQKRVTILAFDRVLGVGFGDMNSELQNMARESVIVNKLPAEIQTLVADRETARLAKDFAKADDIRRELDKRGFRIDDSPAGPKIYKVR